MRLAVVAFPGSPREVALEGRGLHTGAPARVVLRRCPGPVRLASRGFEAAIDEVSIVSTDRATTVEGPDARLRVATVEHALAAFGGLGVFEGVTIAVEGPELPLLDGGASRWCVAIAALGAPSSRPPARVARRGAIDVGASRYEFTPGDRVELHVRFETDDARIAPEASWYGDPIDFRDRVAAARTFAFAADVAHLAERRLARHVDPRSVVLVTPDAVFADGGFSADEPARHKLLDLVGDSYLFGGPPLGKLRVVRPGHGANALALRRAFDDGILVRG